MKSCVTLLLLNQPNIFLKPLFRSGLRPQSTRIGVERYAVSKISMDSCARGLKQFKVAFAESSLECPYKPRSQFLPPHSKVHGAHSFISAKQVLQAVV